MTAEAVIAEAVERFHPRVALACSFQKEETVLLDVDAGTAVRLNSTGAWIWEQLEQPRRVGELASGLAERFEIDEGRALGDVVAFAREMARRELLAAS